MKFDTVVVGKGLVGSAAAKYLALGGETVAIIGPDEPTRPEEATVFSSHYDSGRVQRQIAENDAMTRLNLDAHQHYPWLEKESGIVFQGKSGCLYVNPLGPDEYLDSAPKRIKRFGTQAHFFTSGSELESAFPDFRFPAGSAGLFEASPSGHIDPRRLIQAQLAVLEKNGGSVVREVVRSLEDGKGSLIVATDERQFEAQKVLLATGAFTNLSNLVPRPLTLTIKSEIVVLARLTRREAERLQGLPSLLYEIDVAELEGVYSTRPLPYPDGQFYLKIGCNLPEDIFFENNLAAVQAWFRTGNSEAPAGKLRDILRQLMPHLQVEDYHTRRCILTRTTQHNNPYIGRLSDRLFTAIGQGWGASTSNSIGRAASHFMLTGRFPTDYSAEWFHPVFD
jgi:glycine/D-amino acid oxidase-like deaminating enzyme